MDATTFVKRLLLDPSRQIELEDYVMGRANEAARACTDIEAFPTSSPRLVNGIPGIRFLVEQANRYWGAVEPLLRALIPGCAWGQAHHAGIWTRSLERVAAIAKSDVGGQTTLLELRKYPILPLLFGSGLAATHRQNYLSLKAVALDAQFSSYRGRIPLVATSNPWRPFGSVDITAQVLALERSGLDVSDEVIEALTSGRKGKRFTPASEHLHDRLRPYFADLIPDDDDYSATFSRLEILLGALTGDVAKQAANTGMYIDGAWFGSFTWREKYLGSHLEETIRQELAETGDRWPPLAAGLFGGKRERAEAALDEFIAGSALARRQRWV